MANDQWPTGRVGIDVPEFAEVVADLLRFVSIHDVCHDDAFEVVVVGDRELLVVLCDPELHDTETHNFARAIERRVNEYLLRRKNDAPCLRSVP